MKFFQIKQMILLAFLFVCPFAMAEDAWKIVLPESPNEVEQTAAEELQTHIKLMTGTEVPVISESSDLGPDHLLYVGSTKHAAELISKEHPEPFLFDEIFVKADGTNLTLTGHERRGALYAVYTFLEDVCGCRWFTEDVSRIPKMEELKFPADLKISYAPKLISREMYNDDAQPCLISARNKGNGNIDDEHGGNIPILNSVHTFNHYIPEKRYSKDHPEWFSEINGVRLCEDSQLCLTNDEMREELTKNVLKDLRNNPGTKIVDISQNDRLNFCTCDKCRAIDEEEGSHAGTLVRFLNMVAADIEKEFPDVLVESLAYQYTRKPPKNIKPRGNIVIRLCTIECDFGRPLSDPKNAEFMADIDGWSKIANHLFIWDYVTNYSDYLAPHPNWHSLAPNIRTFVDHNAIGLFEEGEGDDFDEMKNWVLMKLMWNPDQDYQKLMADFSDGYYGEAATPYIMEYWRLLTDRFIQSNAELGCFFSHPWLWLDLETINAAAVQMNKAAEAINNTYGPDSPNAKRLRKSRIALDSVWVSYYDVFRVESARRGIPFEGPDDIQALAKDFSEFCLSNGYRGPNIDVVGEAGAEWFKNVAAGSETLLFLPLKEDEWQFYGSGKVDADTLLLNGKEGRTVTLYEPSMEPKELMAEFRFDGDDSSCGFVFGADDAENFSYLRLDKDWVTVASSSAVEPSHIVFHKMKNPRTSGEWHKVHIIFCKRFISVYVDEISLFQWMPYPAPDKKIGKIGFMAEGGEASLRDIILAGKKNVSNISAE